MNLKTKKIIAREGLIIVGIILLGISLILLGNFLYKNCIIYKDGLELTPYPAGDIYEGIKHTGLFLLYFSYPVYWLIRFIIWAIRILKQK